MKNCSLCSNKGKVQTALNKVVTCTQCNGEKSRHDGYSLIQCSECKGKGYTSFEFTPCPICQ